MDVLLDLFGACLCELVNGPSAERHVLRLNLLPYETYKAVNIFLSVMAVFQVSLV